MGLISRLRDERYCAFCRQPRRVYLKKHVDLTNVLGVLFLSLAFSAVAWGGPDPRLLVLFGLFLVIGETFIYLRWRGSVVCRLCGFDPVVYKQSPQKAAEQVNHFFREAAEKPEFLLSRSPFLELHRKLREQERRRQRMELLEKRLQEIKTVPSTSVVPSMPDKAQAPSVPTR